VFVSAKGSRIFPLGRQRKNAEKGDFSASLVKVEKKSLQNNVIKGGIERNAGKIDHFLPAVREKTQRKASLLGKNQQPDAVIQKDGPIPLEKTEKGEGVRL